MEATHIGQQHAAWNKGKLVGQKTPIKLKEIWAVARPAFVPVSAGPWPRPAVVS